MAASPNITLTALLQDIFGNSEGAAGYPSRMCITLCGYGALLPRIAGTSMLARVGPTYIQSTNGSFSTPIYGNDQITPAGTYYAIEILDNDGNVVQSGAYQLTGSGTQDLSTLTPIINPGTPIPSGYIGPMNVSGAVGINFAGWSGPITIDLTLTGDVSITLGGWTKGQIVNWIIRQDGVGGHAIAWTPEVKNPAAIQSAAGSVSTQSMSVDYQGNFYPQNGWQ